MRSSRRLLSAAALLTCGVLAASCATSRRQLLLDELHTLGYQAEETERGVVVFLPDVLFAFDRAELTETGRRKVEGVADLVDRLSVYEQLAVEGHADAVGPEAYNLRLSETRARVVADALVAAGIEEQRLEVKGFGEEQPVEANRNAAGRDDPAGRRLNRRVETILLVP